MRYVLDSCVAVKWFLAEPDSPQAIRLRDDFDQQVHELLAPDIFPVEIAHALSRAERRGLIQPPEGSQHLSDLFVFLPSLHSSVVLLPRAYELSSLMRIGVYDCLYVALAEREQCDLITADSRLVNSLRPMYPFITSLASLP
ncbi:MAG: type II toxin-antitoxin system VapC family toxin [Isosphaeraceae bacterium]